MKSKATQSVDLPGSPFPVVGIGASAGGLQAFEGFLSVLPDEFSFSIVFVQHLSPKHESLLPDLLRSRRPNLDIAEIADGMEMLPGQVYLAPPAKEIRLDKGFFRILPRPDTHVHLPVDEFLFSLAEHFSERAIAVIFSGAGTDGARGVQAVRSAGGTIYVQDPATAEFPAMPLAAINTGRADGILSPENVAREILRLYSFGAVAVTPENFVGPEQIEPFFRFIYEKTGHRFHHYKKTVVARRIRRRMYLHGISKAQDYLEFLGVKDSEAGLLASDLMIGVTSFFRDRLAWKDLHIEVTRKLAAQEDDSPIRVWTPACATGEEAYSIAMLLQDELDVRGRKREIQIFATDVNDKALEQAREGTYPTDITTELPPDYLKGFFTLSADGLSATVSKEIRQYVVFARHDLLSDPPFSRLDLIICRNLLIYLEPEAQEKCIALFHYALKENGFLFLGNAESPSRRNTLFNSVGHKKCRLYQKAETTASARMPLAPPYAAGRVSTPQLRHEPVNNRPAAIQSIQEALLEEYAPAAVAIDRNYDILYHNGPTSRYLRQPRGIPTQNLFDLLPESLRNRIRSGLFRAAKETKPVSIGARISDESERKHQLTVRISKLRDGQFLVVFREKSGPPEEPEAINLEGAGVEETAARQLESELSATREALQSHIEQLKSLNEELQSSNEELQAANEELETSREELQSLNEELITVNAQLQTKIEEQEELNNDLSNFLTSTSIPTIFLDLQFRVKRFTPAMTKLIKLIPSDLGRPIIDMSQENLGPDPIADVQSVLESLVPLKKDIQINDAWYARAVLPYRTSDNRIEGVVITYTDITERRRAEGTLRESESRYRELVQNANSAIIRWKSDGSIVFFNEYAQIFFGYSGDEVVGKKVTMLVPERESTGADLTTFVQDIVNHPENYLNNVNENICKDGRRVWMAWTNKPILDETGRVAEILAVGTDITKVKQAEEALQESEQRVRRKLDSILSPEGDIGTLELSDIIDIQTVRSLISDFSELAHVTVAILDLKGNVLVGEGWQVICTKFHRAHPDACKHCTESDTQLTKGVLPGESRLYKCKNNMWDIATPIVVGGQHVGNIFSGQFFFDDEPLDYELFRKQAAQYGFDEKEYIDALEAVPRLSRDSVDKGMAFLMKLAGTLSQLSYSNIKLARTLTQRDALTESLKESEERMNRAQEIAHLGGWELDLVNDRLTWSDEVYRIFGLQPQEFAATYQAFLEAVHPDDRAAVDEAYSGSLREGRDTYEIEHRVVRKSSREVRVVREKCEHIRDESGRIIRSVGMVHDITDQKRAEETVRQVAQFPGQNPNPVLRVALDGTLLYANTAAKDMLGAMAGAETGGLPQHLLLLVAEASQQKRVAESEKKDSRGRTFWFSATQPAAEGYVNIYSRDITERKQVEEALRESEERFRSMFERHKAVMLLIEAETGLIVDANAAAVEYYGYPREHLSTMHIQEINQLTPEDVAAERQRATGEQKNHFVFQHRLADGRLRWVDVYSTPFEAQGKVLLFSIIHDITERKQAEEEREMAVKFLSLANEAKNTDEMVRAAITFFQEESGCEAVGIRLKRGDDYPYYETRGFPKEFILLESNLCTLDQSGKAVRDSGGFPMMDCMCGNVVQGRFDPSKPFFSPRGSFWSNSTTELLVTITEADRLLLTRNRCNGEGYESVALIALRAGAEPFGLLQMNDRQTGRFSPRSIALFERFSDYLAISLAKFEAEENLKKNLVRLDIISTTASRLLMSDEPQLVVESLCRRVMEHLDCHAFFNFLVDEERNCLRLNAYAGIPEETAREIHFLDFGVAVCGCAARDACRIVAENIPTTPDIRTELVRSFGINAYACHPLVAEGRVIGTLSFGTCSRLTFTEDELSLMKTVADQVATAMERMRLLRASEERSEELERRVEERTAELKQREEMLRLAGEYSRSLLEANIDPLVTIDREGRISDVNTATELVTGYPRETLIGTDFADYFTDSEKARAGYLLVFQEGLVRDYELEIRHREGRVTPVLYNASVYRDGAGSVAGVFAAARDITEQRQLEDHIRQAHKMEAIGTLAGGIAHDFNNILASILGFTEMAIEDSPDRPLVVKNLENVLKSSIRARDLVKQILAFSRKSENTRSPIHIKPLVKETVHFLRASIPTTIEITQSITAASDTILASPVEVQQILMNLGTNAAFAMHDGGGILNISLLNANIGADSTSIDQDLSPGEYILLSVEDTGTGMKPEVMKRVFEPFFTTKGVGQGTGMGLAVVYGLAKSLGGAVTVESELGKGSTFHVYLPTIMLEKQATPSKENRSPRGHERILFVDDEEMLTEQNAERLKNLGYDVVATTDSREALRIFEAEPDRFDLIVTDYTMPHLTGIDLAGKLLKLRPDLPVILCTGYSDAVSSKTALKTGVKEFLMKPLTKQEMAEAIRRVLDGKSVTRDA